MMIDNDSMNVDQPLPSLEEVNDLDRQSPLSFIAVREQGDRTFSFAPELQVIKRRDATGFYVEPIAGLWLPIADGKYAVGTEVSQFKVVYELRNQPMAGSSSDLEQSGWGEMQVLAPKLLVPIFPTSGELELANPGKVALMGIVNDDPQIYNLSDACLGQNNCVDGHYSGVLSIIEPMLRAVGPYRAVAVVTDLSEFCLYRHGDEFGKFRFSVNHGGVQVFGYS